jgi:hypothetical protein
MRIIKTVLLLLILAPAMMMLPTSCAKTVNTLTTNTADSASQIITSNDELNINYEMDQAINEALLATTISYIASGDTMSPGTGPVLNTTLSGAIIDTSHIPDSAIVRITYYGKNADQTKGRTGVVTIQLGRDGHGNVIPWKIPGAVVNISFEQYEVIVLATNVSIWINGTAMVTNMSGGQLTSPSKIILPAGDSLQDRVSANISFTYNDNTGVIVTWPWTIAHTRTFSFQNSVLTSVIRGDSTVSGTGGISATGTARIGSVFYTQITAPVVQSISSSYILSEPLSGGKIIHGIPEPLTVAYGVNSSGVFVQSSNPYGYKISWMHNGGQAVSVVSY